MATAKPDKPAKAPKEPKVKPAPAVKVKVEKIKAAKVDDKVLARMTGAKKPTAARMLTVLDALKVSFERSAHERHAVED